MNDDERFDLSPLDPELDPGRLDRVVGRIMDHLGPGIVPPTAPIGQQALQLLAIRFRPLFAAASIVALLAAATLAGRADRATGAAADSELLVLPQEWQAWLATDSPPSPEELFLTFVGASR